MATWTEAGETWNTTAGNKTVVATPVANDLIVVIAGATSASTPTIGVTDNNADGLGTYALIASAAGGGTGGLLRAYVRNALIAGSSTTFTAAIGTDTGGGLTVMRLSGMNRVGMAAVRQSTRESTQTENPPQVVLPAAALTGNPIIVACLGEDNPLALTAPTSFTETTDTGWATPTTGIEVAFVNSGVTASTLAWSGGASTDHCEVALELQVGDMLQGDSELVLMAPQLPPPKAGMTYSG